MQANHRLGDLLLYSLFKTPYKSHTQQAHLATFQLVSCTLLKRL